MAPARAGSQDFAATLSDAGKPARKIGAKHQDAASSGRSLPAPGNQPPLAPIPPPPAKTAVAAAVVIDAASIVKGPAGNAPGPAPSAVAAAASPPAKAGDAATSLTPGNLDAAAPPLPALAPAAAAPTVPAVGMDATTPSASAATMPHAAGTKILATPGTSNAARAATVPAANADTAAPSGAATNQESIATGNSSPSSATASAQNDSTWSTAPAAPGTDATAQALMAAAAAQDTNAPLTDSPFSDATVGPSGGVQQGTAMLSDDAPGAAAAAASVAAMAHVAAAATSAATTAATAASVAQALSVSAGAADKRSRSNGPDSTLSGASNDGSVGAAQLLTSNTSTDSVPMPTFKIAAGVDTAQFGQGVADRVSLMMDSNLTNAKLQVNPPALGPIEVRIALQGGHAQIWLSSHSALTRDALESSSSKLREMLGSQGFSQVSVDISQRSFQERSPQSQAYETAPSVGADSPVLAQAPVPISRSASGLLDAYA